MLADTIYQHLKEFDNTKIGSHIEPTVVIEPTYTISKTLNNLLKKDMYDAFCMDGKSVLTTNIRSLLAGKDIVDMKISPFLNSIPHLKPTDTIQDAANIMAHYRIRSAPVVDKGKIVGAVSAKKILQLLAKRDNSWITANLILTKNPITVSSGDSLGFARKLMASKRIDHLPVIRNGSVKQVLTSYHLVYGINPHEGLGRKAMGMEKIRNLESKIGNVGSTRIPQCSPNDNLNSILKAMLNTNTTCCLVNLWGNLQGIITIRDILNLLAIRLEGEIPLFLVGMPEDQKNVDLITSKFSKTLKRIQKVYSEIQEAKVSIKQGRSGKSNKKAGKFEVSIMITTPHQAPILFKEVGFDLGQTIEKLSQKLLRRLSKRAKRRYKKSVRKISLPIVPV